MSLLRSFQIAMLFYVKLEQIDFNSYSNFKYKYFGKSNEYRQIWNLFFLQILLKLLSDLQMGIQNLLNYLKPCIQEKHISHYKGKRAAVDTYAWIHKFVKALKDSALSRDRNEQMGFVKQILQRIKRLRDNGVEPVMVFDGGPLQSKNQKEKDRMKQREERYKKAKELLESGDQEGYKKMFTSIEITPDIAYHIIIELRKINVEFIVAPYEADSELAYLCRTGYVDFILTEDSDLLVFGTPKVLYKFDFRKLTGQEICLNKIKKIPEAKFLLNNFTHCMFMTACILSGCDYLKNLPKIGLVTAIKKVSIYKTFKEFFYRVGKNYPIDYEGKFMKAFLTFRYQRVYCPRRKMCVQINEIDFNADIQKLKQIDQENTEWSQQVLSYQVLEYVRNHIKEMDFDFLGPTLNDDIARKIAEGIINPITFQKYKLVDLGSILQERSDFLDKKDKNQNPLKSFMKKPKLKFNSQLREQSIQLANLLINNTQKRSIMEQTKISSIKIKQKVQEQQLKCSITNQKEDYQQSDSKSSVSSTFDGIYCKKTLSQSTNNTEQQDPFFQDSQNILFSRSNLPKTPSDGSEACQNLFQGFRL